MSASAGSGFSFKVLADTFGPVKFKNEHPKALEDESDVDLDTEAGHGNVFSGGRDIPDSTDIHESVVNVNSVNGTAGTEDVSQGLQDANDTGNRASLLEQIRTFTGLTHNVSDDLRRTGISSGTVGNSNDVSGDGRLTREPSGVVNPALDTGEVQEGSSTHSSVVELSAAQERGMRTSFREQPRFDTNVSKAEDTAVKISDVHVRSVPGDLEDETPVSTASSTSRFFLTRSGQPRYFDVSKIQQNSDLGATTRDVIRREHNSAEVDTVVSKSNGIAMVTGGKAYPEDPDKLMFEEKTYCCPKLTVFLLAVLAIIAGVVVAVSYLKEDRPDTLPGSLIRTTPEPPKQDVCTEIEVKLREQITMTCFLKTTAFILPKRLRLIPPVYVNEGNPILIGLDSKTPNQSWSAEFDTVGQSISIQGPPALCSSAGEYRLQLLNSIGTAVYNTYVKIKVLSEIHKVNVSLSQSVEDNSTDFKVACGTRSGCEQSFVDFFAEINKEEQYLRGVNFTCTIDYNDYDGYSVSCTGVIPDFLMSQFGRITCRPRSNLLDDLNEDELKVLEEYLELPECDISKHCGYKCDSEGDYFLVNSGRCDIFHRCFNKQVYTSYCANGTYFDPGDCTCRHTNELTWCQDNGAVKLNTAATKTRCMP